MLIADALKDLRGSKYDDSQALDKQRGISSVELNVVLAGISVSRPTAFETTKATASASVSLWRFEISTPFFRR
jgi:hypothetical protein